MVLYLPELFFTSGGKVLLRIFDFGFSKIFLKNAVIVLLTIVELLLYSLVAMPTAVECNRGIFLNTRDPVLRTWKQKH